MSTGAAVFTYGSLMFDAVWSRVVSGHYQSVPARLDNYRRLMIRGESYPALESARGEQVLGRVWLAVTAADVARLDRFEGGDYRRVTVQVDAQATPGERQVLPAQAYLWLDPARLLASPWDARAFEQQYLATFLSQYAGSTGG